MSLKTILSIIGHFFASIFDGAERAYESLEKPVQGAILYASGIMAIINANLTAVPADVWALIQVKYPNVTQENLRTFLISINNKINVVQQLTSETSFEDALIALRGYLEGLKPNEFIAIIKTAVTLLAMLFAPEETVIQKIELVLEWVYQTYIKHDVPVVPITTTSATSKAD